MLQRLNFIVIYFKKILFKFLFLNYYYSFLTKKKLYEDVKALLILNKILLTLIIFKLLFSIFNKNKIKLRR